MPLSHARCRIRVEGRGLDPEDGDLTGDQLRWTSSLDGELGTGGSLQRDDLRAGDHRIELVVTDSDGAADSVSVNIRVVSPSDVTPPQVVSGSASPDTLDVQAGPDILTLTVRVTDDLSGVSFVQGQWQSPSGGQLVGFVGMPRISGDQLDGEYLGSFEFPQNAESGTWTLLRVGVTDNAGNFQQVTTSSLAAAGVPTTVEVLSIEDITPPQVVSGSASPDTLDVQTGPDTLTLTVRVTDDLSGVSFVQGQWQSPSGGQLVGFVGMPRISGDQLDGEYQGLFEFPQNAQAGTWTLLRVGVTDNAGNFQHVTTSSLAAAGVPTTVEVR